MATIVTTGLYDFDPKMTNTANAVTGERQTLQTPGRDDYYFIIPHAAPFFATTLKVFNDATNVEYKEGVDWLPGHYFVEAMQAIDKPICGSIRFLRRDIAGIVRLEYHTLGGQWGFNDTAILAELSNKRNNPLIRSWGMIAEMPATFPVVDHDQSIDSLVGSEELEAAILNIGKILEANAEGATASHLADFNNPHKVTATQVNLGNVPNYLMATDVQASAGTLQTAFMSPYLTKLAISTFALTPLNAHVADKNNPHGTTKAQVGLDLVANYPPATRTEAIDPTIDNRYLTPYTASLLMASQSDAGQYAALQTLINNHIQDKNNPHGTTAHAVGTYTSEEIDSKLGNVSATDTPRFEGMTGDEWRATLPSFSDMQTTIEAIGTNFSNGNVSLNQVSTDDPRTPDELAAIEAKTIINALAHYNAYGVWGNDFVTYTFKEPEAAALPAVLPTGTDRFVVLQNAVYWLDANGAINNSGSASIAAPAGYAPGTGFLVANAQVGIYATKTAVYAVNEAGKVIRYVAGGAAPTVLSSSAYGVSCNTEFYNAGEMVLIEQRDGTTTAYGNASFVSVMNSIISALGTTRISASTIGDDRMILLLDDGSVRIYNITRSGTTIGLSLASNPTGMPANPSTVTGQYKHYAIFNEAGAYLMLGDNSNGQLNLNPALAPFPVVACGYGYTVTVNDDGEVSFWGDSPTNALLYKAA